MLGPDGGAVDLISNKKKWGVLPRSAELLFNELEKRSNEGNSLLSFSQSLSLYVSLTPFASRCNPLYVSLSFSLYICLCSCLFVFFSPYTYIFIFHFIGIVTYKVTASFLQIYNENLYDLLRKSNIYHDDYDEASAENGILKIREITKPKGSAASEAHEVYVSGLSEFRVQTAEDVLKIIAIGSANRATRSIISLTFFFLSILFCALRFLPDTSNSTSQTHSTTHTLSLYIYSSTSPIGLQIIMPLVPAAMQFYNLILN